MKKINSTAVLIVVLVACVLFSLISVFVYYFVVYVPSVQLEREAQEYAELTEQQEKKNQEADEKATKEIELETCLSSSYDNYVSNWNGTCELNNKPVECGLPTELSSEIEDRYDEEKEECYYRYETL